MGTPAGEQVRMQRKGRIINAAYGTWDVVLRTLIKGIVSHAGLLGRKRHGLLVA